MGRRSLSSPAADPGHRPCDNPQGLIFWSKAWRASAESTISPPPGLDGALPNAQLPGGQDAGEAAAQGAKLVALPEYFCLMGQRDTDKLGVAERIDVRAEHLHFAQSRPEDPAHDRDQRGLA